MFVPWRIMKRGGMWFLIERFPEGHVWAGQIAFRSPRWQNCVDYMNAAENGDIRTMHRLAVEQARLCRRF